MARSKAPVAIVTGAAHGIGRAIAQRLLNEASPPLFVRAQKIYIVGSA
jgi:NAD(P)-dependent dehydrogenase (short-subunit alcohol dehydrogenase family)